MNPMDLYACQWESKDCGSTCDMSNIAIVIQSVRRFLRVVCRITLYLSVCLSLCEEKENWTRNSPMYLVRMLAAGSVLSHVHWTKY